MTINNDGFGSIDDWLEELLAENPGQNQQENPFQQDLHNQQAQTNPQDAPMTFPPSPPLPPIAHQPMGMYQWTTEFPPPSNEPDIIMLTPEPQPQRQPPQAPAPRVAVAPQIPPSPYGSLAQYIDCTPNPIDPLYRFLMNTDNKEILFDIVLNNQSELITALQHESCYLLGFKIKNFIEDVLLIFYKKNLAPPMDFFSNLLKYSFSNFGTDGSIQDHNYEIIRSIILQDNAKLASILNNDSNSKTKKLRIRRLLTTLACKFGYKPLIDFLIRKKALLFSKSKHLAHSAVEWLCIAGDLETLEKIHNEGGHTKTFLKHLKNSRALEYCLSYNNEECLAYCLENGCDPDESNALITAIKNRSLSALEILLPYSDLSSQKQFRNNATPLHVAIKTKNPNIITKIFASCKPEALDKQKVDGKTALHLACEFGCVEAVKLLISGGASLTVTDRNGNTPLHAAFRSGSIEIQDIILSTEKPLLTFTRNKAGKSVFDIALEGESTIFAPKKFIRLVAKVLANEKHPSYQQGVELLYATLKNEVIKRENHSWLCDLEEQVSKFHFGHKCATLQSMVFSVVCELSSSEEVADYIRNAPDLPSVNQSFDGKTYPLHLLISRKCENGAILLIQYGANPAQPNPEGLTALHLACIYENAHVTEAILSTHPEVMHVVDNLGLTPLHHACRSKNKILINLLLRYGSDVSARTKNGDTALHYVCSWHGNNLDTVKTLLQSGANPRLPNGSGLTPLYLACQYGGDLDLLSLLINSNATLCIPTRTGITPLHLLCLNQSTSTKKLESIIQLMVENGANINAKDKNGLTPLFYALMTNCDPILISKLLELGANPTTPMNHKITPLHLICLHGKYKDLAYELIARGVDPYVEDEGGLQPIHYAIHIFDWQRPMLISGYKDNDVDIYPDDTVIKVPAVLNSEDTIELKPWTVKSFTQDSKLIEGTYDGREWSNTKKIEPSDISQELLAPTLDTLKTLLKSGLKITKPEASLFKHLIVCGDEELFTLAIENLDIQNKEEVSILLSEALIFASNKLTTKSINIIKKMIDKGANINARDEDGKTWLQRECEKENNLEMIKTILLLGANVNIPYPDRMWKTPCYVILEKHSENFGLRGLMMRANANVNFKDGDGDTLLHHAVNQYLTENTQKNLELVIRLLECGADVNIKNKQGVMPVHLITKIRSDSITRLLPQIISPFNVNIPDDLGVTPYHNACRYCKKPETIKGLREKYEANPSHITKRNESALHFLAMNDSISEYDEEVLRTNQQNLLLFDEQGETPLSIAEKKGRFELIKKFLQPLADQFNERVRFYEREELEIDLTSNQALTSSLFKTVKFLQSVEYVEDLFAPLIEISCAIGVISPVSSFLRKMTKRDFDNLIFNFKQRGYRDIDRLKQFLSIGNNHEHMKEHVIHETIPPAPSDIEVGALQTMFETMNAANRNRYQKELEQIQKYVSCIKSRKPVTGAPNKEKYPEDFVEFYNTLENLTIHVIFHLKNKDDQTQKDYLLLIADRVRHCGTRWNEEFTMLYNIFSEKPTAKTFFELLVMSLQKMREGIIVGKAGTNVHSRNEAKRLVGKQLGIPVPTAYNDTTFSYSEQELEARKNKYLSSFHKAYQPHIVCMHLLNEISHIYRGMSTRDMMLLWLRQNVPSTYKVAYYRGIINEVNELQKNHDEKFIRKHLQDNYMIYVTPGQSFIDAIKEDRVGDFRDSAFNMESTHRTTLTLETLIDILIDKKVLGRRKFKPSPHETTRKRANTISPYSMHINKRARNFE